MGLRVSVVFYFFNFCSRHHRLPRFLAQIAKRMPLWGSGPGLLALFSSLCPAARPRESHPARRNARNSVDRWLRRVR